MGARRRGTSAKASPDAEPTTTEAPRGRGSLKAPALIACAAATGAAAALALGPPAGRTPDREAWGYLIETGEEGAEPDGWEPAGGHLLDGVARCNIDRQRVCGSSIDHADSHMRCLNASAFRGQYLHQRPVLLSGLMDGWPARRVWRKGPLLKAYGERLIPVASSAEYIFKGGLSSKNMPLRAALSALAEDPSLFVFDSRVTDFYMDDFHLPHLLSTLSPPPGERSRTDGEGERKAWHMLSLGGDKSGLGWHMHGATWIGLVHGRKRWALYAPGTATGSERGNPLYGSREWFERVYPTLPEGRLPLECTQEPGEILYLPGAWAHLTMNLGEAIGVGAQVSWKPVDDEPVKLAASGGYPEAQMLLGEWEGREDLLAKAAASHPMAFSEKLSYVEHLMRTATEPSPKRRRKVSGKSPEVRKAVRALEQVLEPIGRAVESGAMTRTMAAAVTTQASQLYRSLGNALRERGPLDSALATSRQSLEYIPTPWGYAAASAVTRQLHMREASEEYLRACLELSEGADFCRTSGL